MAVENTEGNQSFTKGGMAADENTRTANKATQIILDGKMLTTITVGKSTQKQPSEAIQRCFAGKSGKSIAKIVIARAKADTEEGEKLRAALEADNVSIEDWEEFMNSDD